MKTVEPNGSIVAETKDNIILWSWEGGPIVEMTNELIVHLPEICRDGNIITAGPYTLRIIAENETFFSDTVIAARISTAFYNPNIAFYQAKISHNFTLTLRLTKYFIVRLLGIWGLATTPEGSRVGWSDIKTIGWLVSLRPGNG